MSSSMFLPGLGKKTSEYDWDTKEATILQCLQGSEIDDKINLWELRELALSPGGLLDPKLRKRAWPILTACHLDLSHPSTQVNNTPVTPSRADLVTLRRDVKRTVWDIAEHFSQQRSVDSSFDLPKKDCSRRVTFALDQTIEEEDEEEDPPDIVRSATCESDGGPTSPDSVSPTEKTSFNMDQSSNSALNSSPVSLNSSFNGSSRRVRWRKASRHEQKICSNVVMTVLRMQAPESSCFADDRFRYFSGLHNLVALILLNLESPSLTSLVLGKLAVFHLRDSMRHGDEVIESAIQLTFFPLLERVDHALYKKVCVKSGVSAPRFVLSWISAWFASDVGDVAVASRLIDVFVVSHPIMPVYVAVALLVHHRKRILASKSNTKSVQANIRSLSLMATLTAENGKKTKREESLAQAEEIIADAIRYMERFPPSSLPGLSEDLTSCSAIPAIAMIQTSQNPSWFDASNSLTEWGVLQLAKAKREGKKEHELRDLTEDAEVDYTLYPTAVTATGKLYKEPKLFFNVMARELLLVLSLVFILMYVPQQSVDLIRNQKPVKITPMVSTNTITPMVSTNTSDVPDVALAPENRTVIVHVVAQPEHTIDTYELDEIEREFNERILQPIHRAFSFSQFSTVEMMMEHALLSKLEDSIRCVTNNRRHPAISAPRTKRGALRAANNWLRRGTQFVRRKVQPRKIIKVIAQHVTNQYLE